METKNNDVRLSRLLLPVLLLLLCLAPLGSAEDADPYSPEELEEIVAPIALYPDVVLSSMLPASAVPTDVVKAARWLASQDGEITAAPEDSGWDDSVQALVQYPDVLTWMSENLDWLEMLGYAVAVQEGEVLQAVQDFRMKAKDAGNLETDDHIQVQQEDGAITIEPAQPQVVYVPTYDPVAVIRPGYRWPAWGVGFAMGAVGAWAWHGIRWGGHGHGGSINTYNNVNFNFNNNGSINRGNIGSGNRWNAPSQPNRRPNTRPNQRPRNPDYGNRSGGARPGRGGVKPGKGGGSRPGQRPGSRPGDRPGGSRPGAGPGGGASRPGSRPGGGASRPGSRPGGGASRPGSSPGGSRPSTRPSPSRGNQSVLGGSSKSGRSTKQASSRGNRSMSGGSRGSSSRSSGSRGGSRGGGSRGGGGGRRR